jgi:signal peptidase I
MSGSRRRRLRLWAVPFLNIFVALLVVALIQSFVLKVYRIPSSSMEQTLQGNVGGGDRVLVNRTAFLDSSIPEPGAIIVFTRPATWNAESQPGDIEGGFESAVRFFGDVTGIGPSNDKHIVKRVVAHGGQTIACCDSLGHLQRDGQSIDEPYIHGDLLFIPGTLDCATSPRSLRCFGPFSVEEGHLVVLGDNRSASADSAVACRTPGPEPTFCVRTVPASSVVGRVFARIWPINRAGGI